MPHAREHAPQSYNKALTKVEVKLKSSRFTQVFVLSLQLKSFALKQNDTPPNPMQMMEKKAQCSGAQVNFMS